MRAYYFTPLKYGRLALQRRRLKVSRILDLNDPYELLGATMSDDVLRGDYMNYRQSIGEARGIICFSRGWAAPIMWSHYADRHRGVCLGLDVNDDDIFPVSYAKERFELSKESVPPERVREVLERLIGTKDVAWSYEDEVRIWCSLDSPEDGLFFEPFNERLVLREVIMGVRCSHEVAEEFRSLIEDMGGVQLTQASLSHSEFRVIQQP